MNATTLLARPYVVYQWAVVLREINPHYAELEVPTIEKMKEAIERANKFIVDNAVYSNEDHELRFEEDLGADIAGVRARPTTRNEDAESNRGSKCHVPVQYAYVVKKHDVGSRSNDTNDNVTFLRAAAEVFDVTTRATTTCSSVPPSGYESSSSSSSSGSDVSNNDPRSFRREEPESEFDKTEYALCTAWPDVFLFRTGYNTAVANMSPKQRHHLLHQFTCNAGWNRQLLGYLFNSKQRHKANRSISATVKGRRKAIEAFAKLYEQQSFPNEIKAALENPNGEQAKGILKLLMPILKFAGEKTASGAFELHQTPTRICESAKRYFSPNIFVTIALDDQSNPLSFRLSFRMLNSTEDFPSQELKEEELKQFIEDGTVKVGEGTIDCSYRARATQAMDNPVAYVTEYKACMLDIFSILFGIEPSATKLRGDSDTVRKTKYYRDRKKGIAGYMLALNNVTEEHKRGPLHSHLVGWGGLSASLLQRAAGVERLCRAISAVLDSQFRARLDVKTIQQLVFQNTFNELHIPIPRQPVKPPMLLQYIYEHTRKESAWKESFNLRKATEEQAKRQQYHDPHHPVSCHEGFNGHTGCRFFKASNASPGTWPSLLEAEDTVDRETGKKVIGKVTANSVIEPRLLNTRDSFDIRKKPDDRLIVWELDRPKLPEESVLKKSSTNDRETMADKAMEASLLEIVSKIDSPELLNALKDILKKEGHLLKRLYDSVQKKLSGEPEDSGSKGNGSVVEHMPMISRCTGSHNNAQILGSAEQGKCVIFYTAGYMGKEKAKLRECLTVLSKSDEHVQKFPSKASDRHTSAVRKVQHLLTRTLNQLNLLQEVSDYQVAATLMEYPIELSSDSYCYIHPASCLAFIYKQRQGKNYKEEMDKMFASANEELDRQEHQFQRDLGYESYDSDCDFIVDDTEEMKEQEEYAVPEERDGGTSSGLAGTAPFYVSPEMYESLGPAPIYTINDGVHRRRQAIPYPYHYCFRGKKLQFMNRLEYDALIGIRHKGEEKDRSNKGENEKRPPASDFEFGLGHILQAYKEQYLRAKHRTVICCGTEPPYPGEEPTDCDETQYKKWRECADRFAAHILILFRPEEDVYEMGQQNMYQYNWDALSTFLDELLESNSLLSRLRLRAIEARVHGLRASFRSKLILTKYRGQSRALWTDSEKKQFRRDTATETVGIQHDGDVLDEYTFQQTHSMLGSQTMTQIRRQLSYCKDELASINAVFSEFDKTQPNMPAEKGDAKMDFTMDDSDMSREEHAAGKSSCCLHLPPSVLMDKFDNLENAGELPNITPSHAKQDDVHHTSRRIFGNDEQERVRKLFERHVRTDEDRYPFRYLLTGPPGTGKSHVIKMVKSTPSNLSDIKGLVKTFAFFGIAAIGVEGTTISSVIHATLPKSDADVSSIPPLSHEALQQFCNDISYNPQDANNSVSLIVIDEISTVSPVVLAIFSLRLQQATGIAEPFGSIPILLVGDFSQLPPVHGESLAHAAVQIVEYDHKRKIDLAKLQKEESSSDSDSSSDDSNEHEPARKRRRFSKYPERGKYSEMSLFCTGCQLLESCRWLQLTEQHCAADDPSHMELILLMAGGGMVTAADLRDRYQMLSPSDVDTIDSPWLDSTILVATNREHHFLTHVQCQRYARAHQTHVIRWRVATKKWEQAPNPNFVSACERDDPCFWEYFVAEAGGFFTDNVNKGFFIANGTNFIYHSITPASAAQRAFLEASIDTLPYGSIITLDEPPLSVNVKLIQHEKKVMDRSDLSRREKEMLLAKYDRVSLGPGEIVVPVIAKRFKKEAFEHSIVQGGSGYRPSRVEIKNHFPIEPAFAATIHKAQGQTLDRVILALSHREASKCNLSYEALCVALSRVRSKKDIRLLLLGNDPWATLQYVSALRPDPYVKAFFAGFITDTLDDGAKVWNGNLAFQSLPRRNL